MKNRFLLALMAIGLVFFTSCGDDDDDTPEPVSPIVGEWTLDLIINDNFPVGFEGYEGAFAPQNEEVFTFNEDDTYTIEISRTGPDFRSNGTFVYEGDDLELTPDEFAEGLITDYVVEDLSDTELSLSYIRAGLALPDAIVDTVDFDNYETQEEFDEIFEPLLVEIEFRELLYFEK